MAIQKWSFQETPIKGLVEIAPFNAEDVRGCFTKDYSKEVFEANGITYDLAEVFYTTSHKGVIRALHFQREKQQPKLVRCIWGHVWDVVVDLRKNSSTFKQWLAFDLYGTNSIFSNPLTPNSQPPTPKEILVPAGCAHGYLVLEDSIVSYKCAEKFYGEYDDGVMWNDPDLAVAWPLAKIGGAEKLIVADKDKNLNSFQKFMELYGGF